MSIIRIDKEHIKLLDKLIVHLRLRGQKISKRELIGKLIENALIAEGIKNAGKDLLLENDPAWKGLKDTFKLGISNLSESVDELLYEREKEE